MADKSMGDLAELVDLINLHVGAWEHFGYANPPDSACGVCGHDRTDHLTRAPSRPEPYFCAECDCRQFRPAYAVIPPLGERSADAIKAGHEAISDIDKLIARLHQIRQQLVGELRQDDDIRMARPLPGRCGDHHASGVTNCTRVTGHDGAHHNGSGLTWGGGES